MKHSVCSTITISIVLQHSIRKHLFIYLFIDLFIYSFIYLSIYLFRVLIRQYSASYSHIMISMIFFFLCHCFDSCLIENIQSQRLYEIHAKFIQQCYRQCFWFLQTQQQIEQIRLIKKRQKVEQVRLIEQQSVQNLSAQIVENVMKSWQSFWKRLIQQQVEQKRIEKARLEKKRQEIEKQARIEKKRLKVFACKRCSVKFSSNTKFHQHICDHHTKKSKFVVSNLSIFFTSSQSIFFSVDNLKLASQSRILFSTLSRSIIFSFSFTSKRVISFTATKISLFSDFASEFVFKRSESASFSSSSQKFVTMRSTFFFKSIFATFTKFYLTMNDLFRMFVEKFKSIDLQQHQKHQFSLRNFDISKRDLMQMRITSYFLLVKSTKFEIFTSVHVSIKQSIRISSSRFSFFSSFRFRSYFSIRFLFSTNFFFSSVCWRCQEFFVIYLFSNEFWSIVARAEIFMKRRERRLFV